MQSYNYKYTAESILQLFYNIFTINSELDDLIESLVMCTKKGF